MSRIAHISAAGSGGGGGTVTVVGNHTPTDNYANPTDALNVVGLTMVWDGVTWDRWTGVIKGDKTPGDTVANPTEAIDTRDFIEFWESGVGTWKRWRSIPVTNPTGFEAPTTQMVVFGGFGISDNGSLPVGGAAFDPYADTNNFNDATGASAVYTIDLGRTYNELTGQPERARVANADAKATTGIRAEAGMLYNGATWDRPRVANADNMAVTGIPASGTMVWDGTAWDRWTGAVTVSNTVTVDTELAPAILLADNMANPTVPQVGAMNMIWDGVTWDRWTGAISGTVELGATTLAALETVTVLQGTSPWVVSGTVTADTELPPAVALADDMANPTVPQVGAHNMVFDGTTWDRMREPTGDAMAVTGLAAAPGMVWNGTTWDRLREPTADAAAVTGIPASGLVVFNGTTWDRVRSAGSIGAVQVGGPAAHDSAVAGNPVLIGGYAVADNTSLTDVTAGDVARALYDLKGVAFIKEQRPRLRGIYFAGSGPHQLAVGADAANGGRVWLVNTSSTVALALRKVIYTIVSGSALVALTFPRINIERMTFTGTPSGATITPALRDSTDAANTGTIRTAATGMTITAGATLKNFSPITILTAVGTSMPSEQRFDLTAHVDSRVVLRQNQGIVVRQADAGTAADTRRFFLDFEWEEYDL